MLNRATSSKCCFQDSPVGHLQHVHYFHSQERYLGKTASRNTCQLPGFEQDLPGPIKTGAVVSKSSSMAVNTVFKQYVSQEICFFSRNIPQN